MMTLIRHLTTARSYGVASLDQLRVFVLHASQPGYGVARVLGETADKPTYRLHYNTLRKLMMGSPCRGHDGLGLLYFSEQLAPNKEYAVRLTRKGKALFSELTNDNIQT